MKEKNKTLTGKRLLNTKEATQYWGISRHALRTLVHDGILNPIVVGTRNWKFIAEDYSEIIRFKQRP